MLSCRNIPTVAYRRAALANGYELLNADYLLLTQGRAGESAGGVRMKGDPRQIIKTHIQTERSTMLQRAE